MPASQAGPTWGDTGLPQNCQSSLTPFKHSQAAGSSTTRLYLPSPAVLQDLVRGLPNLPSRILAPPDHPSPPQGNLPHTCDLQPQDLRSPLLLRPDGVGQGRGAEDRPSLPAPRTPGQGWAPGPESPCMAVPCTRSCPFSGLNMLSVHSRPAGPC